MSVPKSADFYLPTLKGFEDGEVHTKKQIKDFTAEYLNLTEEDKIEMTRGGNIRYITHSRRAVDDLYHAGLLKRLEEGSGNYQITDEGMSVLNQNLDSIDRSFLRQYPSYNSYKNIIHEGTEETETNNETPASEEFEVITDRWSPTELFENAYDEYYDDLSSRLLNKVLEPDPYTFERIVLDLLIGMGYGDSNSEWGRLVGGTGDGGIDGFIKQDYLGLDKIYFQAKQYSTTVVGSPQIRDFKGALDSKHANKGVFITASRFSAEAKAEGKKGQKHIILIDGIELTRLMIKFNVGVSLSYNYEIKEIDDGFFEED